MTFVIIGTLVLIASGICLYFGITRINSRADNFNATYSWEMASSKDYTPMPKTGFNKDIWLVVLGFVLLVTSIGLFVAAGAN